MTLPFSKGGLAGAITLGVVAMVLTAALATSGEDATQQTRGVPCGTSTCIPNLKFDEVTAVLTGHGYLCAPSGGRWTKCSLKVGITSFEFSAEPNSGLISRLSAAVRIRDGAVPLADKAVAFMQWVAILAVGSDPADITQVQDWVNERIKARQPADATINGYKYSLTFAGGMGLDLDIFYDIGGQR